MSLIGETIYLANTICGMMTNLHVMCQAYTLWRWQSLLILESWINRLTGTGQISQLAYSSLWNGEASKHWLHSGPDDMNDGCCALILSFGVRLEVIYVVLAWMVCPHSPREMNTPPSELPPSTVARWSMYDLVLFIYFNLLLWCSYSASKVITSLL